MNRAKLYLADELCHAMPYAVVIGFQLRDSNPAEALFETCVSLRNVSLGAVEGLRGNQGQCRGVMATVLHRITSRISRETQIARDLCPC
jgi:hypothetical protein